VIELCYWLQVLESFKQIIHSLLTAITVLEVLSIINLSLIRLLQKN